MLRGARSSGQSCESRRRASILGLNSLRPALNYIGTLKLFSGTYAASTSGKYHVYFVFGVFDIFFSLVLLYWFTMILGYRTFLKIFDLKVSLQ